MIIGDAILANYKAVEPILDQLGLWFLLSSLRSLGLSVGSKYSKNALLLELGLVSPYHRYWCYLLEALADKKLVELDGDMVTFLQLPEASETNELYDRCHQEFTEFSEVFKLLKSCCSGALAVMQGKAGGLSLTYPAADINHMSPAVEVIEVIYGIEPQIQKLKKTLESIDSASVLEVGGGTGQVTWRLLEEVRGNIGSYCFTDISRFFLVKAKKIAETMNLNGFISKQYDITKEPEAQGVKHESIDLIVAVNVIHAAPNVMEALEMLRNVLKPSGKIYLVEHTTLPIWANLMWGVIAGWWAFEDDIRKQLPTLERSQWEYVFKQVGFENIEFNCFGDPKHTYLGICAERGDS